MSTLFRYRVLIARRRVHTAWISAPDEAEARQWIRQRHPGARMLSLWACPDLLARPLRRIRALNLQMAERDLAPLLRQMALLLKAGVPVDECIANLLEDAQEAADRTAQQVLSRIQTDMHAGLQLSLCLARQPESFPESVRCLAAVGDQTGLIGEALLDAADNLDKSLKLRSSIHQALIYPFFTFGAMFAAAAFWIVYVIPNMAGLFKQMNAKLPAITVATMAAAEWLSEQAFWIALVLVVSVLLHLSLWRTRRRYRIAWQRLLARLPVVRSLISLSSLGIIFESLRVLYGSGIDLIRALEITRQSIKNDWHQEMFDAIRFKVAQGFTLTQAMRGSPLVPRIGLTIVSAGERSGTLDSQFQYLASHYAEKLDALVKSLAEVIKPLIVIVAGGFFIFMIVALLLPIYDLVKQTMAANYR